MAEDIPFVARAIVDAERSGQASSVYARLFDLGPEEEVALIERILGEGLTGCELSCEQVTLALVDGEPVGSIGAWVEADGAPPSHLVRANLLAWALGAERWQRARPRLRLLSQIDIERAPGALQIESVYVAPSHRGHGIAAATIASALAEHAGRGKAQILSLVENTASARAFTRAGFAVARTTSSTDAALLSFFPGSGRVLWEKAL